MSQILISRAQNFHQAYQDLEDEKLVMASVHNIEVLLTKILKKYFLPSLNGSDDLFDKGKPLEPFRAKIHTAYRIGFISQGLMEDLLVMRLIRKEFRNEIDCHDLNYKGARELCAALRAPAQVKAKPTSLIEFFADTPRGHFEITAIVLSSLLEDITVKISEVSETPFY